MSPFTLIVFDLDGTLIDSRRDIADTANALLVSCGAAPLPEDAIGRMVGDGAATLVNRAFAASGVERPPDALTRYLALYRERLLVHTRPYPGIVGALEHLATRATLAVLTNKPLQPTRDILAGLGLERFFPRDAVVGGDGPFPRKPDPAGLQHLETAFGSDRGETVFVGDSVIDFQTARAAGTSLCVARYGFGSEAFPFESLGPRDRVIDAASELTSL